MKYALLAVLIFGAVSVASGEETLPEKEVQEPQEHTKEELLEARKTKERFLAKLRQEIAARQKRLSDSRAAPDSKEKQELKNAVAEKKNDFAAALNQPVSHWLEQSEINKKIDAQEAEKAVKESRQIREQAAALQGETKKNRPLSIEALGLHLNVINLPQIVVVAKNNTDIPIEAYTVNAECFNKFDEPVGDFTGNNVYRGISQTTIQAGQQEKGIWQMSLHRNTAYARVWITRVRFANGTEWTQTKQEAMDRGLSFFRVDLD